MTTLHIDCETCPVRGRHCGDCFVPVLARAWVTEPEPVGRPEASREQGEPGGGARLALDFEEQEAVEAFARAGLISPREARTVRAQSTIPTWVAVG